MQKLSHVIKTSPVALATIIAGGLVLLAGTVPVDFTVIATFALLTGILLTVFRMVQR